ncbi:MAG: right-handed parallel beta-helix repeat-containing protein [Nocardioides sp.]
MTSLLAVPATPATAAVVTCGTVVTTSITLTSDVGPCPGDALIAGADNITIDLGGYTISGTGTGAGVGVAQRTGVTVTNGTIQGFHTAVVLDESTHSTVSKLVLRDNIRGVDVAGSDGNLVDKNTIRNSALDAIRLGLSADNVISKNTLSGNVFGIGVADFSTGNLVEKNVLRDTRGFGIAVFSDSDSNRIEKNDVQRTLQGDGITVSLDSDLTFIFKNIANVNSDDGIDTDNPQTTITGNIANNNGDLGIEAVAGTTDGGGNLASGNGNPAQCDGVSCS